MTEPRTLRTAKLWPIGVVDRDQECGHCGKTIRGYYTRDVPTDYGKTPILPEHVNAETDAAYWPRPQPGEDKSQSLPLICGPCALAELEADPATWTRAPTGQ